MHHSALTRSVLLVTLFTLLAAGLRIAGYRQSHRYSFDEDLHVMLSVQLRQAPGEYSPRRFREVITGQGRDVPEHYDSPLYAHPPLYAYLASLVHRARDPRLPGTELGYDLETARTNTAVVSIAMGALIVPVVFLLGWGIFDRRTGGWAAAMASIDPLQWMCAQKLWMASTLTFWLTAGMCAMVWAGRRRSLHIVAGLCFGLAGLTKSYALMVPALLLLDELLRHRGRRLDRWRSAGFLLPWLLQGFWLIWNLRVYGLHAWRMNFFSGEAPQRLLQDGAWLVAGILLLVSIWLGIRKRVSAPHWASWRQWGGTLALPAALVATLGWILVTQPGRIGDLLQGMLKLREIPTFSYAPGILNGEPWFVYLERMVLFSPLYVLALAYPFRGCRGSEHAFQIGLTAVALYLFLAAWGNYQCRYIVPLLPLLIPFSARIQQALMETQPKSRAVQFGIALLALAYLKTACVGILFALPNQGFYF